MVMVSSRSTPRKSTLSLNEFSHLVSESLDVANAAHMSLLPHNTLFSEPGRESPGNQKASPFQRMFSRHSPASSSRTPSPAGDASLSPRRISLAWPFSRSSPSKQRFSWNELNASVRASHFLPNCSHTRDQDTPDAHAQKSPAAIDAQAVYGSGTAILAGSTSSLGSLVPPNEQLFHAIPRDDSFDDCGASRISFRATAASPITFARPRSPTRGHYFPAPQGSPLQSRFTHRSSSSLVPSCSEDEIGIAYSSGDYIRESTETCPPSTTSEGDISEDDPTPRAATFDKRAIVSPQAGVGHISTLAQRRRLHALSLVMPSHPPDPLRTNDTSSDTETETEADNAVESSLLLSPNSTCMSMTSSSVQSLSASPPIPMYMPIASPAHVATHATLHDIMVRKSPSPRPSIPGFRTPTPTAGERARAGSRCTRTPPPQSPGPPPSGPLPSVPASPSASTQPPSSEQELLAPVPVPVPGSASVIMGLPFPPVPPLPPLPPALKAKHSSLALQVPLSPPSVGNLNPSGTAVSKSQTEEQVCPCLSYSYSELS
ncbi:hypothetical protein ID866_10187 [Astraeus odoratus]|nr:hypothetical protein ID866_10187 [Astraeus odoratus]